MYAGEESASIGKLIRTRALGARADAVQYGGRSYEV
jgi:hypothetical protein